jgi:hypothetical protein
MSTPIPIIVHFVGIALFSSQVPNDCGLKVILPKVVYTAPKTAQAVKKTNHVEDHAAVLIFRTDSYVPGSSWGKPIPLPKTKGQTVSYEYVKLDGDRVRFDSGIDNQGLDFDRPQLPPLVALCPAMTTLDRRFQPPYNGAAAVFDLPQGAVKACIADARIDTEVKFNGDKTFVISASTMRKTKELRLKPIGGKIELIVANVPVNCLKNGVCSPPSTTAMDGMSHVHAYYGMVSQNTSCNKTIADWIATTTDIPTEHCSIVLPAAAGGPVPQGHVEMTDLECSNSRYP